MSHDIAVAVLRTERELVLGGVIIVKRYSDLFEIVLAPAPPGRLACGLYGRQQERDKNADDRDNDQQLDEGERATPDDAGWEHGAAPEEEMPSV